MCSICQDDCNNYTVQLSCGHSFHADCIVKWLRQPSSNASCPNCRHIEGVDAEENNRVHESTTPTEDREERIRVLMRQAGSRNSSKRLKSKAATYRKWSKQLSALNKAQKAYYVAIHREKRYLDNYRQNKLKEAKINIEKQVWSVMKSNGYLQLLQRNNYLQQNLRRVRSNLSRATNRLLN